MDTELIDECEVKNKGRRKARRGKRSREMGRKRDEDRWIDKEKVKKKEWTED